MHERMAGFLRETTAALCGLLEKQLPTMASDPWQHVVLPSLTDQQRWYVERRGITSLSLLDLPGLLRILDKHWYTLSNRASMPPEMRHYSKELQLVLCTTTPRTELRLLMKCPAASVSCHLTGYVFPALPVFTVGVLFTGLRKPLNV